MQILASINVAQDIVCYDKPTLNSSHRVSLAPVYDGSLLVVRNYSGLDFNIYFSNGATSHITGGQSRSYCLTGPMALPNGNVLFTPVNYQEGFGVKMTLQVELYDPAEPKPEMYPVILQPPSTDPWISNLYTQDGTIWTQAGIMPWRVNNTGTVPATGTLTARYVLGFDYTSNSNIGGAVNSGHALELYDLCYFNSQFFWNTTWVPGQPVDPLIVRFPYPMACIGVGNAPNNFPGNLTFRYVVRNNGGTNPESTAIFYIVV